jgi:hypothetical protein
VQNPAATDITFAPVPSTAEISPTLEQLIGELVAAAAALIAEGVRERARGKLTTPTKMAAAT